MPVIRCDNIDHIQWANVLPGAFNADNSIHVWRVKISDSLKLFDHFHAILSIAEKERAAAYLREQGSQRSIASRGALRMLLGKYLDMPPEKIEFEKAPDHKPFVRNTGNARLHYNVSHSGDWILIAFGENPVGIDVENIDHSFNFKEVLTTCFSADERGYIVSSAQPSASFYTLWTRKEAMIKATAKGIDDDISFIPCMDGLHVVSPGIIGSIKDWQVSSFEWEDSCMGSVAYERTGQNVFFFEAGNFINELL
jgi:4'-phosphopantetheinyl transferase